MDENKKEFAITASRSEYKGYPMIVLTSGNNEKYPFQFGLQKARRILACIEDIKLFVAEEEVRLAAVAAKTETKVAVK
jgi:hypothetical protein